MKQILCCHVRACHSLYVVDHIFLTFEDDISTTRVIVEVYLKISKTISELFKSNTHEAIVRLSLVSEQSGGVEISKQRTKTKEKVFQQKQIICISIVFWIQNI